MVNKSIYAAIPVRYEDRSRLRIPASALPPIGFSLVPGPTCALLGPEGRWKARPFSTGTIKQWMESAGVDTSLPGVSKEIDNLFEIATQMQGVRPRSGAGARDVADMFDRNLFTVERPRRGEFAGHSNPLGGSPGVALGNT